MKVTHYRQCRMKKTVTKDGKIIKEIVIVSHLPEQFAKAGDIVKLKDAEGKWVDGWEILSTGELVLASIAEAGERLHKKHRDSTDVVLSDLRKSIDDGSYKKNRE